MMESRGQFTFYRSYFDAIKELPKKEQTAVLLAICAYALDGAEPELTGTARAVFTLVRPTLDTGRRKAETGKRGGSRKQSESKTEANDKQTAREKEKEIEKEIEIEIEIEKEIEIENDSYLSPNPLSKGLPAKISKPKANPSAEVCSMGFDPVLETAVLEWIAYKAERREAYKETGLRAMLSQIRNNADRYGAQAVADLIRTCMASNWQGIIFDRLGKSGGTGNVTNINSGNPFAALLQEVGV